MYFKIGQTSARFFVANFYKLWYNTYKIYEREYLDMSKHFKNTLIILWVVALCLSVYAAYITFFDRGYAEVCFIDVGQGDSCFVRSSKGDTILIDGGDNGSGEYELIPFLRKQFVPELDAVFISHLHSDHTEGIYELIDDGYPIEKIYVSDIAAESEAYTALISRASVNDIPIETLSDKESVVFSEITFTVITAGDAESTDDNDTSVVMRMDCGENSFLFTGDATRKLEKQIIDNEQIDVDFLKVAHHGSYGSSDYEFVSRGSPEISVISVGEDNRYNHPSEQTLETLSKLDVPVIRTDKDGTVTFVITENNILDIKTSRSRY